jgi:septal ring factor EnvC (AmiA/AmiB activator)
MSSTHSLSMIIAASAPGVSASSSDPFWQRVVLAITPDLPLTVLVFVVLFVTSATTSELGAKMDAQSSKLDAQSSKLDAKIDAQSSKLDAKIDKLDAKIDAQNAKLDAKIDAQNAKLDTLIATITGRLDNHEDRVKNQLDAFNGETTGSQEIIH